jgi:hypothetical protein
MDTEQIDRILSILLSKGRVKFLGVFPKDLAPNRENITYYPTCFVLNTDPSSKPGAHWTAYFMKNQSETEFFDSYGLTPEAYDLPSYNYTLYNKLQLQGLSTRVCGHYCIRFIYLRSCGVPLTRIFISACSHSTTCNDYQISRWILSFSNIYTKIPRTSPSSCNQNCCSKSSLITTKY